MTLGELITILCDVVATFAAGDLGGCIVAWLLGIVRRGAWGEA